MSGPLQPSREAQSRDARIALQNQREMERRRQLLIARSRAAAGQGRGGRPSQHGVSRGKKEFEASVRDLRDLRQVKPAPAIKSAEDEEVSGVRRALHVVTSLVPVGQF